MNHLNPKFLAIMAFLITGLIWSGGHVAWLVIMGLYVAFAVIG